jgi:hypothetical protein
MYYGVAEKATVDQAITDDLPSAYVYYTGEGSQRWFKSPYEAAKSLENYLTGDGHTVDSFVVVKIPNHLRTSPATPTKLDVRVKGRVVGRADHYLNLGGTVPKPKISKAEPDYYVPFAKVKDTSDSVLF